MQATIAVTGSYLWAKRLTYKQKPRYFHFLVILALVGLGLSIWQAVLIKQGGEEAARAALGDADHPPFIALISLPGVHRFVVTNGSDYPAYGIRIRMYDDTVPDAQRIVRNWEYSEMAAHAAFMDDQLWFPPDNAPQRHFTATIATRTGIVTEELMLRPAGNNQWERASRVMQGMRLLETDIDSAWPRNAKGEVDWGR